MPNLPQLLPGCMVMWQDAFDRFRYALVIQFEDNESYYELKIVQDERIKSLILRHDENNKRWRVLRATR